MEEKKVRGPQATAIRKVGNAAEFWMLFEQFYAAHLPAEAWVDKYTPFRRKRTGKYAFRLETFREWGYGHTPLITFTRGELSKWFSACGIKPFRRRFSQGQAPIMLWEAPI